MKRELPSREEVASLLTYDAATGEFFWKRYRNGFVLAGARAGQVLRSGYRSITINRRGCLEHRLAWLLTHGCVPDADMDIDHINRDRTDNRIENLRVVSRSQNMHNTRRSALPRGGEPGTLPKGRPMACAYFAFSTRKFILARTRRC